MPGTYQYDVEIKSNVAKLLSDMKQVQDRLDAVEGKEYKIKLNVDEKKLSNVISNLEKMLDSLGKGTGDFKQLESLSKELSTIVNEVQSLSKAFGKVDDSGAKTLLSSIQNIDRSLSELSQNILNVNKNMSNMGGNTSGAVRQVENIGNAAADAVKQVDKLADAQSKLDRNANVLNGLDSNISKYQEIVSLVKEYYELTSKLKQPTLKWQSKPEDYKRIDAYLATAPAVKGSTFTKDEIEKNINSTYHQMAKGINEGKDFAVKAMKSAIQNYWGNITQMPSDNELLSSRKIDRSYKGKSSEEYIIPKKYQELEKSVLQETIAMNQNNAAYEEEQKQIKANNAAIEERLKLIRQSIKQNGVSSEYNGEYKMGLSLKASDKDKKDVFKMTSDLSQEEMLKEICNMLGVEIPQNAEKAKQAIREVSSTTSEKDLKDAFQGDEVEKASEAISNAIKEENNILEQNTQKAKENAEAKEKMANADKEVSNTNFSKYDNRLESYNKKTSGYDATIARFEDGGWTSDAYLRNVKAVKDAVAEYERILNNLKAHPELVTEEGLNDLAKQEKLIKENITAVQNMSAAEKGFTLLSGQKAMDKINSILKENSAMSKQAKNQIRAWYNEIASGNPSKNLSQILGEVQKIVNAEVEAGRAGKSMFDAIKEKAWYGVASAIGTYFGFNDILRYGREAIDTIVELDDALVDLKKTTAMSGSELENFYYDSNDVAKQMGVTTKEIIDQASSWSRLGYNTKEASTEMAKLSSQFASISPGMATDTAQEGLVSIMKAWDIDYSDVKSEIMDNINALGNSMAENNQDIVEGMERSAAALAAVGTSYEDAFAMFSGIQEVLQNAEVSGRALRSISMRIRGYDESTEELSSDLENITGELVDLTKTTEHSQGISIFKDGSTTEFKSLVDYFGEIHDIWDEMSQKQQNDFLQKAFGKTQAQAGAALIQNYSAVTKSLEVMDNAAGSSDKEMDTVKQSITYKLNALKQTWIGTVQDIVKRGDLGTIIDSLTKLSEAIGFVLDKFGLIPTVLSTTGIVAFIKSFS